MSHLALYRKYRPETWDEVLGQEAVVTALRSAVASGSVSHAYLFSGSRGTGKTSVARIFARELGTDPADLYEIDAASNNGVDAMRELRDGVNTLPFNSKYKVYLLDEVHMLSKAAFNALLKTLEEPPAHVIFILATTEPHKVLDTVRSRCQVLEFGKPTLETLADMVIAGARKEGVEIDRPAAELIARRGDGAYRDTWGVVERVIRSTDAKSVSVAQVEAAMRAPRTELVETFVAALVARDLPGAIAIANQVSSAGHAMDGFLESVLEVLRLVMLVRFAPAFAEQLLAGTSPDRVRLIRGFASERNIVNAELLVQFLDLLGEVKKSGIDVIPVELALIRILGGEAA